MDIITEVLNSAVEAGGWTIDIRDGRTPVYGWAVGGNPDCPEKRIPHWRDRHGPVLHSLLRGYLERVESAGHDLIGGWTDGDTLVLDAPTVTGTYAEAVELGRERGEQAIYCLHTGETTDL